MARLLALPALLLAMLAVASCGGGSGSAGGSANGTTPGPGVTSTASADDPLTAFESLLDAIDRQDGAAVWDGLSTEAQATLSQGDTAQLVQQLAGSDGRVTLQSAGDETVNGDQAQLQLTLLIRYQGKDYPLKDVAYMVREDGRWRLADHFLQTALTAVGRGAPPMADRVYGPDGCVQGDVLAGVYLPSRLKVLDPCRTVDGTVIAVELPDQGEGDGDISFDVQVSGADASLLNEYNLRNTNGGLHMEIVPADQGRLPVPKVGDHIRVQGPWVTDLVHGHNEIHPVWALTTLGG